MRASSSSPKPPCSAADDDAGGDGDVAVDVGDVADVVADDAAGASAGTDVAGVGGGRDGGAYDGSASDEGDVVAVDDVDVDVDGKLADSASQVVRWQAGQTRPARGVPSAARLPSTMTAPTATRARQAGHWAITPWAF